MITLEATVNNVGDVFNVFCTFQRLVFFPEVVQKRT